MAKLIILSGAGLSAESGLATFRDKNGLWERYKLEEVILDAWRNLVDNRNPSQHEARVRGIIAKWLRAKNTKTTPTRETLI